MKIKISKNFANALLGLPIEEVKKFIDEVEAFSKMNKTEILSSKRIVKLSDEDTSDRIYAYNLYETHYVVFRFLEKRTIVLFDLIQLIGDDIQSLMYSEDEVDA